MIQNITKVFKWFFKLEAASGLVLLFAAILALVISNGSYSELYFVDKNWPDFNRTDLIDALDHYKSRKRKYGSLEVSEKTTRKQVI